MRRLSLLLATLMLLVVVPATSAATPPKLSYSKTSSTLTVSLLAPRAGAWQTIVRGTGTKAMYRLTVTAITGDVSWDVRVRSQKLVNNVWKTTRTDDLSPFIDAGPSGGAVGGCDLNVGLCWASNKISVPHGGNDTLKVVFRSPKAVFPSPHRSVVLGGAYRLKTSQPFMLGPWKSTPTITVKL